LNRLDAIAGGTNVRVITRGATTYLGSHRVLFTGGLA
jgi:hypothetical protein